MSLRRAAAVAVVGLTVLLAPAPLASAQAVSGGWTSPEPTDTHQDAPEGTVTRRQRLSGYAEHPEGLTGVSFVLVEDAAPSPDHPCSAQLSTPPQEQVGASTRIDFSFEAGFPCNRRYLVRATPHTSGGPRAPFNLWVAVAIPPADVDGVEVTAIEDPERGVSVRWEANEQPEPDFQGYEIRRAIDDDEFIAFAEVEPTATSFVDRTIRRAGGRYRYQVLGMRPGPDGSTVYSAFPAGGEVELASTRPQQPESEADAGGGDAVTGSPPGQGSTATTAPPRPRPAAPRRTITTVDTGFREALPFAPGDAPGEEPLAAPPDRPGDDAAVVVELEDDGTGQRDTLLLVAGGAAALMWAMVLRLVSRRAAASHPA